MASYTGHKPRQRMWPKGAFLTIALVSASAAQTQAPVPQAVPISTLRITVTLVQIDAVVTNRDGRHVGGLQASDFELLQDGKPQKISYFSYQTGPPAVAAPSAQSPITAKQVRRTIALVVDDTALSFEDLVRTRDALREFVEKQMEPGDLVSIVRTGGGVALLEQFTTDKRVLLEAIDLLKWRFQGRVGLIPIPASEESGAKKKTDGERAEPQVLDYGFPTLALGSLATIEQVMQGMKGLPGRKSVVFFSDGMRVDGAVDAAIERVTDLANRSAVSLYPVDPAGLRAMKQRLNTDPRIYEPRPGEMERFPGLPGEEDDFDLQRGLEALASRTGGLFYHDRNDIAQCVTEAAQDQLAYYLIGYTPEEGTFEQDAKGAKFHRLTLRTKVPGVSVRWKSGFTGVPDELVSAAPHAPKTREQQLLDALGSPFQENGIKVRLTSIFNETVKTGPVVQSMLHFEAKNLALERQADGTWLGKVDVVTSAYRGLKQPMQQWARTQEIRLPEPQYRRALAEGFQFNLMDKMKLPGMFLMRAVVRDANNQKIGSASQYVNVPDTRKGKLALSGIFVKLAPAEFQGKAAVEAEAKGEGWAEGGPALRRFLPGQKITFGFAVIHPRFKGSEFRVTSQVRIYRNGKLLYTGPPNGDFERSTPDPTRLVGGGLLSLNGQITPGEYLIQVVVTDHFAKKKSSQVAQWSDFEVVAPLVANKL